MNKELALRTFAYLIGHYKTHDETTINTQEIEAIEFMLKINEELEQQCEKQKEVINNFLDIVDKSKMLLNNPDLLDLYLKIKEVKKNENNRFINKNGKW